MMRKSALITAAVAMLSTLAGVPTQAALFEYTDYATWLSAVGPLSGTENFDSFSADASFVTGTVSANNMVLSGTAGPNAPETQKIDATPFGPSGIFASLTPNGTSFMLNDLWDKDCATSTGSFYCGPAGPNSSRIDFTNAVVAWGADFVGISNRVTQSSIEVYDAANTLLGTITAPTTTPPPYPPNVPDDYIQRFFGFALTGGDVADHIVFRTDGTGRNDVFGVDNMGFAYATVGTDVVFKFSGVCEDCEGIVTGQLSLTNFVPDQALDLGNFVSFHYDGSNLLNPFTVDKDDLFNGGLYGILSADGTVTSDLAFGLFDVNGCLGCYMSVRANGNWEIREDDFGTQGRFAVPEPATLALFGLGVVGLAATRRRKQ